MRPGHPLLQAVLLGTNVSVAFEVVRKALSYHNKPFLKAEDSIFRFICVFCHSTRAAGTQAHTTAPGLRVQF